MVYKNKIPAMVNKILKIILTVALLLSFNHPILQSQDEERPKKLLEITIQRGDTLYKFAKRYLDDPDRWPELLKYNRLPSGDPNLILPGDILLVPMKLVKDQIADIAYIKNNVRMRRKEAPLWKAAGLYERLYPEDGIRTARKSFAQIKYLKGAVVKINENSLIFLRPDKKRDEIVRLEVGELRAIDVKVLTASASIDPEKGSEYLAKVDEDKKTTLSVFKGSVDFISSGEMVRVSEGFMSVAELNKPPIEPVKLPPPPEFKGMDKTDKIELTSRGVIEADFLIEKIDFNRRRSIEDDIDKIRIQIARDEKFSRIVIDRQVEKVDPEVWKENLTDGTYWWRAAFVNIHGVASSFSDPVKFIVDTQPPRIFIESPKNGEKISKRIVSVSGKTSGGANITVNDSPVKLDDDGNFVAAVNIKFGMNDIIIRATDSHGRVTTEKITVDGILVEEKDKQSMFMIIGVISSILSIAAIIIAVM